MAKMTIHDKYIGDFTVDTDRKFEGYEAGDITCCVQPFFGIPLTLFIAIRRDGRIIFRQWKFSEVGNSYLHIDGGDFAINQYKKMYGDTTPEQKDTVNGLFSGRIKFEGLKLTVGATLQTLCPIDVKREEELTNSKIFLT